MGNTLKIFLGVTFIVMMIVGLILWSFGFSGLFDWLDAASEAESSFWGAVLGTLGAGWIAVLVFVADIDKRERVDRDAQKAFLGVVHAELMGLKEDMISVKTVCVDGDSNCDLGPEFYRLVSVPMWVDIFDPRLSHCHEHLPFWTKRLRASLRRVLHYAEGFEKKAEDYLLKTKSLLPN